MSSTIVPSLTPVEIYEYAVPPFFGPCAERLLDAARPRPGERVLDLGCGTGAVARQVAPLVGSTGKVTGLDSSPDMLAVARAAGEREGLTIDWHEGRAEALPFPDGSFDLVLCQFALMFFADRNAAAAEMRRVLTAGGRVGIHVFQGIERHPFYATLDRAIARRLGTSAIADIFSLGDADALRALLTQAGFADVEIAPLSVTVPMGKPAEFLFGEIAIDAASIPAMQHLDAATRLDLVASLQDEMAGPLKDVTDGDQVVMTFHTYVARAHR
jgi:ubiquinone/menaquinone biosynthesis C-methylase UbiE